MSAQPTTAGGWTAYRPLTAEDQQVFNKALAGFVGVKYVPEQVATQIVAGVNYRYLAKSSLPGTSGTWQSIVEIYAPLQGDPHITHIQKI